MASIESFNTNSNNQTPINTNPSPPPSTTVPNPPIVINAHAQLPIKLTPTNFPAWHIQFHSLLVGFDLLGFVDGTFPCPARSMTTENTITILNPEHARWIRQDKPILNAIVSSLSLSLQIWFPLLPQHKRHEKRGLQ
ncbi:Retrovirus-related Pol polyprotein from transposon RE1 [Abeliophyllum distichum]|uniref:Retrovirus-related Pol polyprotein from transposon RE1 n=1 Tax=Abeliophyllum distichum TaxID=126358 RepID=A0ABD1QHS0_9LAMI